MPSVVMPISPDHLATLATKQLLGLGDRLLACEESLDQSDATAEELDPAAIRFKDDPRWTALYEAVKAVLATREHVPGADQARLARQARASGAKGRTPRSRPRR